MKSTKKNMFIPSARQQGLSLLELIVAMSVSITLLAGVIRIYTNSHQSSRVQDATARMQENARFVLDLLAQDIRMAGYFGCATSVKDQLLKTTTTAGTGFTTFQPMLGIQGWEAAGTAFGQVYNIDPDARPSSTGTGTNWMGGGSGVNDGDIVATDVVPGTDILRVWGVGTESVQVTSLTSVDEGTANAVYTIQTAESVDLEVGSMAVIGSCETANVVQICTAGGGSYTVAGGACGNDVLANPLNTSLLDSSELEIAPLIGTMYYIGKIGGASGDGSNSPALYRKRLTLAGAMSNAENLLEGVESLQILYGENAIEDPWNTVDRYVVASNVADWNNVTSVRLSLLMRSVDQIRTKSKDFSFHGVDYDGVEGALPDDPYLRRAFNMTINIRNRTLGI